MNVTKHREARTSWTFNFSPQLSFGETLASATVTVFSGITDVSTSVVGTVSADPGGVVTLQLVEAIANSYQQPGIYDLLIAGVTSTGRKLDESGALTITGDTVLHNPPVGSVTLSPASPSVVVGGSQQMTASVKDPNGNAVAGITPTWSSSDRTIAVVDANGKVAGVGFGTCTLTAAVGNVTQTVTVTVGVASGDGSIDDVLANVSGIIGFWDAGTNVTLSGATVSQINDVRGDVSGTNSGYHLPLVGAGAPLPSYDTVAKTVRCDGTQNSLKTATDTRFSLGKSGCLIYIGTVEQANFPAIVSSDDVSQFMAVSRNASQQWKAYLPAGIGGTSDLATDTAIHLFRVSEVPQIGVGTLDAQPTYFNVGDDVRRWLEYGTPDFTSVACSIGIGIVPGNGSHSATTFAAALYLDHEPNVNEMAAIRRFAAARGAVSVGTARNYFIAVGDSITYGMGCTTPATDAWPNLIAAQFANYAVDKRGRGGRWITEILDSLEHLALADANLNIAKRWVVVWAGTNDVTAGVKGAHAYAALKACCQKLLAAGFSVFVPTMMKRTDCTGAAETERQNLNALILQMVTNGLATAVCDIAATVDPTNTPTVSSDGIHPNTTWNVTIENTFVSALQATGKF